MRRNVDILMIIEHVARELDIACAVKHWVESRHGLSLELASYSFCVEKTLMTWNPRVIAVPVSFTGMSDPFLGRCVPVFPDAQYVDLAYEEIYHKFNRDARRLQDDLPLRHVTHHAWGEFYADFLRQEGVLDERIYVNGNPCYSLYAPPYSAYYPSKQVLARKHGLDPGKTWVFVPENYKTVFLGEGYSRLFVRRGASESEAKEYWDFDRTSFATAVDWWVRIAGGEGCEVIVRPRPYTAGRSFADACTEHAGELPSRLHIIKEGTVREWILASDVVFSSISTTLIESAVAGKPTYALMAAALPSFLQTEWSGLLPPVRTYDEFEQAALQPAPDSGGELGRWARERMMSRGDPIRNLAGLLSSVVGGTRPLPEPPRSFLVRHRTQVEAFRAGTSRTHASTGSPLFRRAWTAVVWRARGVADFFREAVRFCWGSNETHEMDRFRQSDIRSRTRRWRQVLRAYQGG